MGFCAQDPWIQALEDTIIIIIIIIIIIPKLEVAQSACAWISYQPFLIIW